LTGRIERGSLGAFRFKVCAGTIVLSHPASSYDVFAYIGRFLQPHSTDDILFGNIFEKRLKLPWGSGAALKFMQ
jgi:hypothetical protein